MEWLQNLLDSTNIPVLAAFLLGLLTAVSPCPLATNITAVGYIGKDIEDKRRVLINGLLYTLGRIVTYSVLGIILIYLLRSGADIFGIQKAISKSGETFLAPALLLVGLLILFADKIKLPSFGFNGSPEGLKRRGGWGALLLGILFALAFCPTSGIFYFGMLIPLSVRAAEGYFLPPVFAVATGLPVVIIAWILAYSVGTIGGFYGKIKIFQKWFNALAGIVCIAVGIYYAVVFYF